MYVFSAIGCLSLYVYVSVFIVMNFNLVVMVVILLIPFFIKIPSFPFFYWLPEVHCEVNTSTSLFLAGLLLKLGVFGILRFIFSSLFLYSINILILSLC